jgi:proteasome accessory factor C
VSAAATERVVRLLNLVPYLRQRPGVRIAEVARTFGISEKQVRNDLDVLWMCGPSYSDLLDRRIEGDAIYLEGPDAVARPLRLGAQEAVALLVGLGALAELPGLHDREVLERTRAKLRRAAGDAAESSERVKVRFEAEEQAYGAALHALRTGRRLHLEYYVPARDELTERDVDPLALPRIEGRVYLWGWCYSVQSPRLFALDDRMVSVTVLDRPAAEHPGVVPLDVSASPFRASDQDYRVMLEVTASGRWVAEYYRCETQEELANGRLRLTLRMPDANAVRRLALRLGDDGQVTAPAGLVAGIRTEAAAALAAYE